VPTGRTKHLPGWAHNAPVPAVHWHVDDRPPPAVSIETLLSLSTGVAGGITKFP
jgi:hypothetical protein